MPIRLSDVDGDNDLDVVVSYASRNYRTVPMTHLVHDTDGLPVFEAEQTIRTDGYFQSSLSPTWIDGDVIFWQHKAGNPEGLQGSLVPRTRPARVRLAANSDCAAVTIHTLVKRQIRTAMATWDLCCGLRPEESPRYENLTIDSAPGDCQRDGRF